jgi:hypothetical protein
MYVLYLLDITVGIICAVLFLGNVSSYSVYNFEGNDLCSFVLDSCSFYML